MELDLGSLVYSAMSRSVSRGGCGLRKSLGCLSFDGWDCVLVLLVVWPEASNPGDCRPKVSAAVRTSGRAHSD